VVLLDGSLAEGSSLINVNLSINTVDVEIGSYGPWVYFDLSRVYLEEHFVNLLELLNSLSISLALKREVFANLLCLFLSKSVGEANG